MSSPRSNGCGVGEPVVRGPARAAINDSSRSRARELTPASRSGRTRSRWCSSVLSHIPPNTAANANISGSLPPSADSSSHNENNADHGPPREGNGIQRVRPGVACSASSEAGAARSSAVEVTGAGKR